VRLEAPSSAQRAAPPPERGRSLDEEQEARWSAWMVAGQAGDSAAYQQLFSELEAVLMPFLNRLLGGSDLVEDCLQESLLAIHKARHTYDARRPFKPWAYTLARYKSVDAIRRAHTRARHEPDEAVHDLEGKGQVAASEPPIDTHRALEGLAPSYREAVVLTKVHGYTLEEAARKSGVSRAAMRSRVQRGLYQLRVHLEKVLR